MRKMLISALLASVAVSGAARAQTADQEEVVVTGQRMDEAVRSFVDSLTERDLPEDQLARWNVRFCPLVSGVRVRQAQYIIDRMSERAMDLGLQPGDPGCRANILIMFASNADQAAADFAENRSFMAYYSGAENGNSLGRAALRAFVASDAPVRWWHISQTVSRDGDVLTGGGETVSGASASRLQRNTRQDFNRVVVIIDSQKLAGIQVSALADYLSMVALAQFSPEADVSQFSSILNIFAERDAGAAQTLELTAWDLSYLQGLYAARRSGDSRDQQADIVRAIEGDLRQ